MKVACDFVSVHNLQHMAVLIAPQRQHRLQGGGGEDVLQLYTLMWYAWLSVSTLKAIAPRNPLKRKGEYLVEASHWLHIHVHLCG